jgi:hypothetical protein
MEAGPLQNSILPEILGVPRETVTEEFLLALERKMRLDPCHSSNRVCELDPEELGYYRERCRTYAQELLEESVGNRNP